MEPASPDATSAKGMHGAEQQQGCEPEPQQAPISVWWSGCNQPKITISSGGCWGFGEHMQLQEECVIISVLLKKT